MRRFGRISLIFLLLAAACSGGDGDGDGGELGNAESLTDELRRPKVGTYTYEISGTSVDPENEGRMRRLSGAELKEDLVVDGDVFTADLTSERSPGVVTTIRTRWEDKRVLLLSSESVTPNGSGVCTFDPPVEILHNPIRAEKFPVQRWESATCSGSISIEVESRQRAEDATGKSWPAWKITARSRITSPSGTTEEEESRWFSPELGRDVRSIRTADATRVVEDGEAKTHNETRTVLRSHP